MNREKLLILAVRDEVPWQNVPPSEEGVGENAYLKPTDLLPVLEKFLANEIGEKDVQEWAKWVLNQEEFCVERWEKDDISDHFEPMWYVLQQLSTPFIDGPITAEKVKRHLSVLLAL